MGDGLTQGKKVEDGMIEKAFVTIQLRDTEELNQVVRKENGA